MDIREVEMDKEVQKIKDIIERPWKYGSSMRAGVDLNKSQELAKTILKAIIELGYRKLSGEPPMLEIPKAFDFVETDAGAYVEGYGDGATAQREADIKWMEGV